MQRSVYEEMSALDERFTKCEPLAVAREPSGHVVVKRWAIFAQVSDDQGDVELAALPAEPGAGWDRWHDGGKSPIRPWKQGPR